ncbi:hypothetical protein GH714_003113 [Hevea brasiliensis]|uniref:Uncharacterized protein n=1 Tax=Hevea brasiliensis TaxID=3981 RepID=A0A6A6LW38_HEVBR|nr:hypothetical protein GH714_003113 [Hevea brasiliensis]
MQQNKSIVDALYKALAQGHMDTVAKFLASGLEWWFHGPPQRQHMMRVLTGEDIRPHRWEIGRESRQTLWQSHPRDLFSRSLPGLLAI